MNTTCLLHASLALGLLSTAWAQPVITCQPQDTPVIAGMTAALAVCARGDEPLSYQWRSHASAPSFTNISFGTEAILVLTNLEYTTRRFSVVVTDAGGLSATSTLAALTWLLAITLQPVDQIVDVGARVTFVVAASAAPLAYQWRFNGADVTDQTNRTFVLPTAQLSDAGRYDVVVGNTSGSLTSRVALLILSRIHGLEGITAHADDTISLLLDGIVPRLFAPYYDLFPLDASTNLADWSRLLVLQRTNISVDALSHLELDATNYDHRFYRTPTNHLVTPYPKPTGPYPVGTVSRLMTDPSRTNRYNIPTNSSFMVTIWYPAEPSAGVLPEACVESNSTLYAYLNERNPSLVAKFVSHAVSGLPVATKQATYPVLLYSHGGGFRRQNTDKALELASHGYVVVAMDHEWTSASVFPNGQAVYGYTTFCSTTKECFQPTIESAIKDYRFVLSELSQLNNDDPLAGRLDLERLGAYGFSAGAVPVAEFGRSDARCQAVALLDPGWLLEAPADLNQLGLQKPFLSMNSTMGPRPPQPSSPPYTTNWLHGTLVLFTNALDNAYWFQIQNASHQSFQDRGSLISEQTRTADPTFVSREQSRTIRACTLSFFNKYLKGEDDHLLDNPAVVHPNIINFRSK